MNKLNELRENMAKAIVGKDDTIKLIITCLIAGGNVLLEDVPGTGKTVMAKSLAKSMDGVFKRVQFTPDLLPSDVTGLNIYNQKSGEFVLKKGPVFANILLADEINRATPRTQSSLLECMEEKQVTIDGVTYALETPFFVIATENPVETAGTFPLPEAQLDRFMMKLSMGLPDTEQEIEILNRYMKGNTSAGINSVLTVEDIIEASGECDKVYIHPELVKYIAEIAAATRKKSGVVSGVSPRGTLALLRAAKAYAYIEGRTYVIPEDIKLLSVPVLAHRLLVMAGMGHADGRRNIIEDILSQVAVPTEEWSK